MSFSNATAAQQAQTAGTPIDQLLEQDGEVEADDNDSAFGTDSSDTTSIASSVYRGLVENGRRYQTLREGEYWGPSDDKQFDSLQAGHLMYLLLDSKQKNPLFRSPIQNHPQNILDVGTGTGEWARQVADLYPSAHVQGIDLYPPPDNFVPPNCTFTVDDALKTWVFKSKFDLVHIRDLFGSFTHEQWRLLYKQAYNNLLPGGWIEQAETGIHWTTDDGSIAPDSILGTWGDVCTRACAKSGRNINTIDTFRSQIEAAGFTDVHEKLYKVPVGGWAKNPVLKEAGKYHKEQVMQGLEGYIMYVMTRYGEPEPWSAEEVQAFLAKARAEFAEPGLHCYLFKRRVWARKPVDS